MDLQNTALVLEGGGMRGAFTAGVLDYFMENKIWFPYTIGVSAGASNGISYAAHQIGRARYSNVDLHNVRPYIGMKYFLKGRGIIDMDFLFYEYPEKYYPLDYDTYFSSDSRFVMVATNCITGEPVYFEEKRNKDRLVDICKASCSLPILCPITFVDGIPMTDGGLGDAIPVQKALDEGYDNLLVVLTRNIGYRKPEKDFNLPWFVMRKYPKIREQLKLRYHKYNRVMDYIEMLERDGKVTVIRPDRPLEVDRIEKDPVKLQYLYEEGKRMAAKVMEPLVRTNAL